MKNATRFRVPTRCKTFGARVTIAVTLFALIGGSAGSAAQVARASVSAAVGQRFDPMSRFVRPPIDSVVRNQLRPRSWMNRNATPVVWFAMGFGNTVNSYDVDGRLVGSLAGLNDPMGVSVDRLGNVYVSNTLASQVLIYKAGATVPTLTLDDAGYLPVAVAIDEGDGTVAVANACAGDPINRCTGDGNTVLYKRGATKPTVTLNGTINLPSSVAYDAYGKLWEVGFEDKSPNGQVPLAGYYGQAGKTFTLFGITLFEPTGIGFDRSGNVDVLDGLVSPCPSDPSSSCAVFSIYNRNSTMPLSSFQLGESQGDFVTAFALDKAAAVMWATDSLYATIFGLLYTYPAGKLEIRHTIVFPVQSSPSGVAVKP